MKFSPNGMYILLGTRENTIFLMDAFKGTMIQQFEGQFNPSFSPSTITDQNT